MNQKILFILLIPFLIFISFQSSAKDIKLPKIKAKSGMDVTEAIETRVAVRWYLKKEVPLDVISYILWAGNGIILKRGNKTLHGYKAVSGATSSNRHSIPFGWEVNYIKLYLLLKKGAYEYIPKEHKLKWITKKNLIEASGSSGSNAYGVILIAADFSKISRMKSVAYMSAGSAAQNMYIAGTVHNIQMLTQVYLQKKAIKNGLKLPENIEPLAILPFGYSN